MTNILFCSGLKQLSVGAVVSKSKYIAIGISPFDLKLSSNVFIVEIINYTRDTGAVFTVFFCLSALAKSLSQ